MSSDLGFRSFPGLKIYSEMRKNLNMAKVDLISLYFQSTLNFLLPAFSIQKVTQFYYHSLNGKFNLKIFIKYLFHKTVVFRKWRNFDMIIYENTGKWSNFLDKSVWTWSRLDKGFISGSYISGVSLESVENLVLRKKTSIISVSSEKFTDILVSTAG